MTSVDLLAIGAAAPEDLAIVTPSARWSYAALGDAVDQRVDAIRRGEVSYGAAAGPAGVVAAPRAGSIVPLVVEPDAQGIVELLALWRLGAVPAPLNPRSTERERAEAVEALTTVPQGACIVLWTSGTSGRPRGVALSFENVRASADAVRDRLDLGPHDVQLCSLALAHVGGLALVTRTLLIGGTLVATGPFDATVTSGLIDGVGPGATDGVAITQLSLVPTQLRRLLEVRRGAPPPPSLRCALIGGAHAPADLVARALRAGWPIALTYGATEMSSQVATAAPAETAAKPGTVGRPLEGVEIRIDRTEEILTRGPTRALGYVVDGTVHPLADVDGWYRTGDLGRLDPDGDLWITGRRSDRIVSGGFNVDAVEVEEVVRTHPAVLDACVAGVPDEEWGERVAVWVDPVVGEFDEERVMEWLRSSLAGPKLPRLWHVEPGLPRNVNGKVDRAAVRARLSAVAARTG